MEKCGSALSNRNEFQPMRTVDLLESSNQRPGDGAHVIAVLIADPHDLSTCAKIVVILNMMDSSKNRPLEIMITNNYSSISELTPSGISLKIKQGSESRCNRWQEQQNMIASLRQDG